MENTLYTFSLNITQPIFTWGKISGAIALYEKVAEVRSLQITALSRKQKSELLGRLDAVYYLRAMQDLVGEQTETANRLVEIITSARDNGMALDVDVLKASIKAQQTAIGMQQLETELSSQLVAIQTLCGDPTLTLDDLSAVVDESAVDALLSQGQDTLVAKGHQHVGGQPGHSAQAEGSGPACHKDLVGQRQLETGLRPADHHRVRR
jgi:outer membrane protein TolC